MMNYAKPMPESVLWIADLASEISRFLSDFRLVRGRGLEPRRLSTHAPQLCGVQFSHFQRGQFGISNFPQTLDLCGFQRNLTNKYQFASICLENTQKHRKTSAFMPILCQRVFTLKRPRPFHGPIQIIAQNLSNSNQHLECFGGSYGQN